MNPANTLFYLNLAEPYILAKSKTTSFKTPEFSDWQDVAQTLRIRFLNDLKYSEKFEDPMIFIKLKVRHYLWDITQKEKKEMIAHADGLERRRITTQSEINESVNFEDGEEVFNNITTPENRRNPKHEEDMLFMEIDLKRAIEAACLTEREKFAFEKAREGYKTHQMGSDKKQSNLRNALLDARTKIRKALESPRWTFNRDEIRRLKEALPWLSLADLAFLYFVDKHKIQKALR